MRVIMRRDHYAYIDGYVGIHKPVLWIMGVRTVQADVLHIVPAYYPTRGGIEVLVENLTAALNAQGRLRHGVLAPRVDGERPDEFTHQGVPIWSIDSPHPDSLREPRTSIEMVTTEHVEFARILLATRRALNTIRPRLIHIHGMSLVASATSAFAAERGIPVLMHVHGSIDGGVSLRMKRQLLKSPRVLSVSDFVSRSIEQETHRKEGVQVIRNGLPDPQRSLPRSHPTVSPSAICLIGRLEYTKGFDLALRAIAHVKPRVPELTVQIIGVGQERASLLRLTSELGLDANVTFPGRLERTEVLTRISESACVMVPSRALEGFSLVALESAFLGRPVVASNIGGIPETVSHGVTGTVVDPYSIEQAADAVVRYLVDPALARTHGTQARERALKEFSLERMVNEIDSVHEQILGGGLSQW